MIRETLGLTRTALRDLQRLSVSPQKPEPGHLLRSEPRRRASLQRPECRDTLWEWTSAEHGFSLLEEPGSGEEHKNAS